MVTRDIKCGACCFEGKVEAHDTVNILPESQIFKNLGKDSSTGFLHFLCPSCNGNLAVDPLKAIAAKQMIGYPEPSVSIRKGTKSNRHVPVVLGNVCLVAAVFIFLIYSSLWSYIVGGTLLMLALVSLKIGLFASQKKIKELTESGPVSKEGRVASINSSTPDLRPDSWVAFYLFYFNQGLGSDASFQLGNRLVHVFLGNLISAKNTEVILDAVDKMHELAAGEFMHILTQLSDYDLDRLKSSAGVALVMEDDSGKAESTFFKNKEDIKAFVLSLRSQGAKRLH